MTDQPERLARAALSRLAEPGDRRVTRAVQQAGAVEVWARLRGLADGPTPQEDLEVLARLGGRLVCPDDDEWPAGLDDLERTAVPSSERGADSRDLGTPLALWVRGALRLDDAVATSVAVVGARASTSYGTHVATTLGFSLTEAGATVVSGGAYGIDGAAHRGALTAGGPTVAVLAGGVDVAYPRGHETLLERVAQQGLLVSEVPPGSPPLRRRFLSRNRLIAALSQGTVVVEAGARSGALSTARHARRLSRHVMAVPGPVTSAMSVGCHQALREWPECRLVGTAAQVLEELGPIGTFADVPAVAHGPRDDLSPGQARILEALPARAALSAEDAALRAGLAPREVLAGLAGLLAAGLVEAREDGYRLTRRGRAPAAAPRGPTGDDTAASASALALALARGGLAPP